MMLAQGSGCKHRLSLAERFDCTETIINQLLKDSYQNPISERAESRWCTRRMQNSRLLTTRAPTRHRWGTTDTKGDGRNPQQLGRTWGMGGVKAEEKWRQDGTGVPEGHLGEGKGSHAQRGKIGGPLAGQKLRREHGQVFPAQLGPQEPAEIPGLILCPPRPLPAACVLREWAGGKGEQK